jgi:hypothetical protein
MLHAFKLYTGADNASHVVEGTVAENDPTDVVAIHFKETPAHSSFDWHDADALGRAAAPGATYGVRGRFSSNCA